MNMERPKLLGYSSKLLNTSAEASQSFAAGTRKAAVRGTEGRQKGHKILWIPGSAGLGQPRDEGGACLFRDFQFLDAVSLHPVPAGQINLPQEHLLPDLTRLVCIVCEAF